MIKKIWGMMKMSGINKENAKNILSNVPENKVFWLNDGRILRNLHDLSVVLGNLNEEAFEYHVNKEKNDFKNWINDVIGDKELANDISKTKSKEIMSKKVKTRINQLNSLIKAH